MYNERFLGTNGNYTENIEDNEWEEVRTLDKSRYTSKKENMLLEQIEKNHEGQCDWKAINLHETCLVQGN